MKTLRVLLLSWLSLSSIIALAQFTEPAHNPNLWGANERVFATVRSGNTIYVGGEFTFIGPNTGGGAQISASTGQAVGNVLNFGGGFNNNGQIYASIPDGNGGWYVGGDFTTVGGVACSRLAHILPNYTLDQSFIFNANSYVWALALVGNTLYVGGEFTTFGGQSRDRIASIDVSTTTLNSWNPGANSTVYVFRQDGNTLYAGGWFTTIGGQSRNRIAAFDIAAGTVTAWNPNANNPVRAIQVSGSTVYVAGEFGSVGGQSRSKIAALDASTGLATSFVCNADGNVFGLALSGNTLYATGEFCSFAGSLRCFIGAVNTTTGTATSWNPNPNAHCNNVVVANGVVYALGNFSTIGGQSRTRFAALDPTTGVPTSLNVGANMPVYTLGVNGTNLFVGGQFTSFGGQTRNRIAALDATTGQLTSWNPNANGTVLDITVVGSTVYVGGSFNNIGGQNRSTLAALDATTGLATTWNPNLNGTVRTVLVDNGTIYAGGDFTQASGQTRNGIASFSEATGALTSWNPNAPGNIYALVPYNGNIIAGGTFTTVGGTPRNRIAMIDASGAPTAWNPNANNSVLSLAISGSRVFVGGGFTNIGGQNRDRLAAVDLTTGLASSFAANTNDGIFKMALAGSNLYLAGNFLTVGGQSRRYIAAVDATTGAVSSWDPSANVRMWTVSASGSTIYVGGDAATLSGRPIGKIAALSEAPCTPPAAPAITASGPTTFCTGGSVTLSAPAGTSYLWSNNATTQSINVTTSGSYTVRTITGSCTSAVSNATVVTVNTPPAKPTITVGGGLTINSGMTVALGGPMGFSYLWSNNATTQIINAGVAGDYTLRVIANGCTSEASDPVTLTVLPANSFVWNGTGNDVDNNNWSSGALPNASVDSIVINSGTVTLTGARTYNRISVRTGAAVVLNGQTLTINGIIRNEGSITGTGSLRVAGNRIYGQGSVNISNFAYSNLSLSVEQVIRVNGTLSTAGNTSIHPTRGNIILTSSATNQGVMSSSSSGTFTNPERFIVERYVAPRGVTGAWMFLGPPVKNFQVSRFGESNSLAPQTYNNSVPAQGSIYLYDPTDATWPSNSGYVKPTGPTQTLGDDKGARVWVTRTRMNMGPLNFRGAPIMEPVAFILKYCANNCTFGPTNGFNLVKNPYAAFVDWENIPGWLKSNITGQIHVWNSSMGQFATYVGGIGVNQGSNLIAPGQAFFVEATSPGALMAVNTNAISTSSSSSFLRTGTISNVLKLQLHSTEMLDEAAIRLEGSATTGFDAMLDARKLPGSGSEITTVDGAGNKLAINTMPIVGTQAIPVSLANAAAGMEIRVEGLASLDAGVVAFWNHPSFTKPVQVTDQPLVLTSQLLTGLTLEFNNSVTSLTRSLNPSLTLLPNPATTSVQLHLTAGSIKGVSIMDQLGRTVLTTTTLSGNTLDISGLAAGTYMVRVNTENGVATQRLAVVR